MRPVEAAITIPSLKKLTTFQSCAVALLFAYNSVFIYHGYLAANELRETVKTLPPIGPMCATFGIGLHPAVALANLIDQNSISYFDDKPAYTKACLKSLSLRELALGGESPLLCEALTRLACAHFSEQNYLAASSAAQRSFQIASHRNLVFQQNNQPGMVESLDLLAMIYSQQKLYEKAEQIEIKCIALCIQTDGNDLRCGFQYRSLAAIFEKHGKPLMAIKYYLRALSMHEPIFGHDDQDSIWLREKISECKKYLDNKHVQQHPN